MIRATTPTHIFTLPFEADTLKKILITYRQGANIVLEKHKEDLETDGNNVSFKLTQEETKLFSTGSPVLVQIRILTTPGDSLCSDIYRISVSDVLNDEVL